MFNNKDTNMVEFGLSDVKYATLGYDAKTKQYTVGEIKSLPGAVELSLPASGDETEFYADNGIYYADYTDNGYDGTLTVAKISDEFKCDVLGFKQDENGVLYETADGVTNEIALWFKFAGDKLDKKRCMYRCKVSRPDIKGKTTEKTKTPNTSQMKIKAMPRLDNRLIKASMPNDGTEIYENFDKQLYIPTEFKSESGGSAASETDASATAETPDETSGT